jgi:drug/metabolite transporter (DMT)-like permease
MKKTEQNILFGYFLLFVQPIFMSSNLIVARGGVEFVPPITLAFLRWSLAFLILLPFLWRVLSQNYNNILNEKYRLFFLGATACGICGAFPFIAGVTTTITNMGIIYSTSPILPAEIYGCWVQHLVGPYILFFYLTGEVN